MSLRVLNRIQTTKFYAISVLTFAAIRIGKQPYSLRMGSVYRSIRTLLILDRNGHGCCIGYLGLENEKWSILGWTGFLLNTQISSTGRNGCRYGVSLSMATMNWHEFAAYCVYQ